MGDLVLGLSLLGTGRGNTHKRAINEHDKQQARALPNRTVWPPPAQGAEGGSDIGIAYVYWSVEFDLYEPARGERYLNNEVDG
jgi:hypothetical protein